MAVAHDNRIDSDHPGPRALEFITWAVDHYGVPSHTGPNRVLITASQAELVLAHPRVDSAGTVAYYVRKLRIAGVITTTRPIEVDRTTLNELVEPDATLLATSGPCDMDAAMQPAPHGSGGGDQAPTASSNLAGLLARHNELVATALSALAESLAVQNQIIATLANAPSTIRETREAANPDLAEPASVRGFREPQKEDRKGSGLTVLENPDLPDLPDQPGIAESAKFAAPYSRTIDPLTHDVVDQALQPLQQWCARNGRPTRIDDRGRGVLAQLDVDALHAGIGNIRTEAAANPTIRNPIGLLIQRAQVRDPHTFAPSTTSSSTGRTIDHAARTLAATLAEQGDGPDAIAQYLIAKNYREDDAARIANEATSGCRKLVEDPGEGRGQGESSGVAIEVGA